MKSKDLYMKIFSFVHENLAKQLKPQEIICDYEANLYYALCIVYEESSIGKYKFIGQWKWIYRAGRQKNRTPIYDCLVDLEKNAQTH